MLKIKSILQMIDIIETQNINTLENEDITSVAFDSRAVNFDDKSTLFFAYKGVSFDSNDEAIKLFREGKIKLIITDRTLHNDIAYIKVADVRMALAKISSAFFNYPMQRYKSIAITGTNGKTTTSFIIESILNTAGLKVVKIGTNGVFIDKKPYDSDNTTPSSYDIMRYMNIGEKVGCTALVIEVSSHALDQNRVYGMLFNLAIFTNLTGDHLDYHKDMNSYFNAKRKLFENMAKHHIVNIETGYGTTLQNINRSITTTYSVSKRADIFSDKFDIDRNGITAKVNVFNNDIVIKSCLIGKHNLENILAAISAMKVLNIDEKHIVQGIEKLTTVEGRLESVQGENFTAFIDYAHTDDALKNVLQSLKKLPHNRLITVFGAGGNRDKSKRPRMMKVAETLSDIIIVTSDNPRYESAEDIIEDILAGSENREKIIAIKDREKAIEQAVLIAEDNDIILIAGKGHEKYQIIGNVKTHFDDIEILKRFIEKK